MAMTRALEAQDTLAETASDRWCWAVLRVFSQSIGKGQGQRGWGDPRPELQGPYKHQDLGTNACQGHLCTAAPTGMDRHKHKITEEKPVQPTVREDATSLGTRMAGTEMETRWDPAPPAAHDHPISEGKGALDCEVHLFPQQILTSADVGGPGDGCQWRAETPPQGGGVGQGRE